MCLKHDDKRDNKKQINKKTKLLKLAQIGGEEKGRGA